MLEAVGMVDLETGADALTMVAGLAYLSFTVVFVVSIVLVGRWIYRAHANLAAAGADGLEFTPGWAVGWYFIPFANLVKPFQAMRELWNQSHSEHDQFGNEAPSEVKAWWGAWIVGNIISSVGTRIELMGGGGGESLAIGTTLSAVGTAGVVLAAVLLLKIIACVTEAQRGGAGAVGVFA